MSKFRGAAKGSSYVLIVALKHLKWPCLPDIKKGILINLYSNYASYMHGSLSASY